MITQFPANNESIDYAHQKIHEGRFFSGGHYNSSLANGASQDILIQNGSSSTFHAIMAASVSGEATIQVFEGTAFSAAGSAMTMTNHNRTSAKVFSGTITYSPTVTGTGTQLNGTQYIAAGDKHTAGTSTDFTSEMILATSTNYLLRCTNVSGSAIKLSMHIEGYQPSL